MLYFYVNRGGRGFSRVVAAVENKLVWPEVVGQEICLRDVDLPYNSNDFCITGMHNIFSERENKNFLYVTLMPRDENETRCHILCFFLGHNLICEGSDEEIEYELDLRQDLSCGYCPIDMQHVSYANEGGQDSSEGILMLAIGSDKLLHIYDVEISTGQLLHIPASSPNVKLKQEWAERLNLPLKASTDSNHENNNSTGNTSTLPFTSQSQWGVPLRLLCEKWLTNNGGGTQGLVGRVDGLLCWGRQSDCAACETGGEKMAQSDTSQLDNYIAETTVDPVVSTVIKQICHHTSFSDDDSKIPTLSAVKEEDEDDVSEEDDTDEQNSASISTIIKDIGRFLTLPVIPFPDVAESLTAPYCCKKALLLDGCVSCLKFYHRESEASRAFRRLRILSEEQHDDVVANVQVDAPSPAVLVGLTEGTVALLSLSPAGEDDGGQVRSLLLPSPSRGDSKLSSSDKKPPSQPSVKSGMPVPEAVTRSVESHSSSNGVVMALAVADVTGDNCNEVLVGYENGLLHVVKLVQKSEEAVRAAGSASTTSSDVEEGRFFDFIDVLQLRLPFPVVNIEFGHILLGDHGADICRNYSKGSDVQVFQQHLVVFTAWSIHVFSIEDQSR